MDQNALAIRQAQWEQIVAECKSADEISSSFFELPMNPSPPSEPKLPVPDLSPELIFQIGDCQLFIDGRVYEQTLSTVLKVLLNA